jgi:tetratricopeptide (TPR) repeat protein
MNTLTRKTVILGAAALLSAPAVWATCGGGGGGGSGGLSSGDDPVVYVVPWQNATLAQPPRAGGLGVYWVPASQEEINKSSLRNSRLLTAYAAQCMQMGAVDTHSDLALKLMPKDQALPVVFLVNPDLTVIATLQAEKGKLAVSALERLVSAEVKQRENALKDKLKEAKAASKAGNRDAAVTAYQAVLGSQCMFSKLAKEAAGELKKLGVSAPDVAALPAVNLDHALGARIENTVRLGLDAENRLDLKEAERLYRKAVMMDPADPAPRRFLAELYRHHIGDWVAARSEFNRILAMPADPMSRAVALHGLGKMTIHEGQFKQGLALMEASIAEFPLPLAYRNLAVYWNSEGEPAKAADYTRKALALDPKDSFNLIFAATFMAVNGQPDEALRIARENEAHMPASYNLAAIYAQLGQRDKALTLLQRHFFEYERTQSVRSIEMMEARVDAVFKSLYQDERFVALTKGADGMLPTMVHH